uniref:Uncharacterized protein n=1 Tax=Palpitomonas bilix TaxID=652834 RepID=A0A7S3D101_9EUKA|mmetsp:Transcript_16842/g.42272  ORF Transcript_16842/g.42272 Transcript_16842/m.42272 type:complete len:296 (+) Transcript_16842:269-1156(+)|eukprot:CAMPEP_0113875878 /NCGR_PEP_ID=MMETSP0780_2-20120614/5177_1 /TAXON_ID=652834 /ORGANISM="Palpitomonas bilix" /LENGTH=295 /DNA_ID=CAMNT_0000861897 /DNA_START=269 /DNA_END=1156 /DNA_ORIENTATION=- /assembly_acc=CAM_ASM_000599
MQRRGSGRGSSDEPRKQRKKWVEDSNDEVTTDPDIPRVPLPFVSPEKKLFKDEEEKNSFYKSPDEFSPAHGGASTGLAAELVHRNQAYIRMCWLVAIAIVMGGSTILYLLCGRKSYEGEIFGLRMGGQCITSDFSTLSSRIRVAFQCCSLTTLIILAGIALVARGRETSSAVDPIYGEEGVTLAINKKFLQNTLEQTCLFAINLVALTTYDLMADHMYLVFWITALHLVARVVFWIGYHRSYYTGGGGVTTPVGDVGRARRPYQDPMWRAPGFALSIWVNIALILANLAMPFLAH